MYLRRASAVILVLLCVAVSNPAAAQQQLRPETAGTVSTFVVDVTGPDTIPVGDLAVFDVGKSTATKFAWTIIPSSKNFRVDTSLRLAYLSGASGTFTLVLVGTDAEGNVAIDTQTVTIGGGPTPVPPTPVPPGPDPTPPGPTPDVPADQFGNVGQLAQKLASGLPIAAKGQAKAVSAIYRQAADRLSDGSFVNVTEAHKWISAERSKVWGEQAAAWQTVIDELGKVWNKFWPMDKGTVVLFYRAVATGWEAAR